MAQARTAGELLRAEGIEFDHAYTSVLKRAIRTLWIALDRAGPDVAAADHDWRLNERHYGGLQGLNKAETAAKHGDEQVKIWRRSLRRPAAAPGARRPDDPSHDPRYARRAARPPAADRIPEDHARSRDALLGERSHRTCRLARTC